MQKTITAIKVEPGKCPCITRLYTREKYLQYAVSEGVHYACAAGVLKIAENVGILVNREAFLLGMPGNRKVNDLIVTGVFYVVGIDKKGILTSLSYDDIETYWDELCEPQYFSNDEIQKCYTDLLLRALDEQ